MQTLLRSERINEHSYAVCNTEPQKDNAPLGYRFNLDNMDFQIRVREMTQDHQNISRHFTQIMALVDRVNCEHLSDEPVGHLVNIENGEFLPSVEDNYTLRKDMIQVVSNILVESLPSFKVFKNIYPYHFEHIYSKEMAKKSTVVYPYSMVLLKAPFFFQELNLFRFVIQLNCFGTVKHDVCSKQAY